jgi:hypothetical protein
MWEKFDDATMGIVVRHIRRLVLFRKLEATTSDAFFFQFWIT